MFPKILKHSVQKLVVCAFSNTHGVVINSPTQPYLLGFSSKEWNFQEKNWEEQTEATEAIQNQ